MEETKPEGKTKKVKTTEHEPEKIGNQVPDPDPAKRVNHPAIGNYDPKDNVKNAQPAPPEPEDDLLA